jgi:hypothetical protein
MFRSRFMPCAECGASVDRADPSAHACDLDRLVDYHLFGLRSEVARLEESVAAFLDSAAGRFEVWLARREVRRRAS